LQNGVRIFCKFDNRGGVKKLMAVGRDCLFHAV
jgi:hypothetical protein